MTEIIEPRKIMRKEMATFLNTGTRAVPEWSLMGLGITSQNIAYNPSNSDETFIHESNARNTLESYKASIQTPQTAYLGDPVFDYVDTMRKNRMVGSDAETQVLIVYYYSEVEGGGYEAELNECNIQTEQFGGDGGTAITLEYTIGLNGDPKLGVAKKDTSTGKITFE